MAFEVFPVIHNAETQTLPTALPQVCARIRGTCGELVQGTLDGLPCLVSCPIQRYNSVHLKTALHPGWVVPPQARKAADALALGLKLWGAPASGGRLTLSSKLPPARGYASSTADIGATLFALAALCGYDLSPYEAVRLATRIEPSDGTFFEGLCLLDYQHAELVQPLGAAPALPLILIDPGGQVDTLAFNRQNHAEALSKLAPQHRFMFELFIKALQMSDWMALGAAATLSARLHQPILFNPLLEKVLALSADVHALGVCRAHSGTLLGVLLDPLRQDAAETAAYLSRRLPGNIQIHIEQLSGGGPYVEA